MKARTPTTGCAVVALVTTPIRQPELRALRRAHVDVIGAAGVVEAENSVFRVGTSRSCRQK